MGQSAPAARGKGVKWTLTFCRTRQIERFLQQELYTCALWEERFKFKDDIETIWEKAIENGETTRSTRARTSVSIKCLISIALFQCSCGLSIKLYQFQQKFLLFLTFIPRKKRNISFFLTLITRKDRNRLLSVNIWYSSMVSSSTCRSVNREDWLFRMEFLHSGSP